MTRSFHRKWLKFTAILVMSFGPIFALGSFLPFAEPARVTMDILGWTLFEGTQSFDHPTTQFLSALAGGFLIGWGAMIWGLTGRVYDAAPNAVRKAVISGMLFWFAVDSLGSIASGHPSNAGFNLFFLLVGVGPMWLPAADSEVVSAHI